MRLKELMPLSIRRLYLKHVKGVKSPYQEYNDKCKCIFIHIPKNAGISIEEGLFQTKVGHWKIKHFQIFDSKRFNEYLKFTFVRNPWSRFVSAYYFLKSGGRNQSDKDWSDRNLSKFENFEEFTLALRDDKLAAKILNWKHFLPQYQWTLGYYGKLQVDFIGRVENIERDFDIIKEKLGLSGKLLHQNISSHPPYQEVYNEKTKKIIGNLYRKDIKLFNYSFC